MQTIKLTNSQGEETDIGFTPGDTLMQTIVNSGASDLLALCGGVCSCATCHVYLDEELAGLVAPADEEENDLLELSEHRQQHSRLSCQIRVTEDFAGKKVTIAQSE